jgi:hypothetical protein
MMGGSITENCGYSFEPMQKFDEVLTKAKEKLGKPKKISLCTQRAFEY